MRVYIIKSVGFDAYQFFISLLGIFPNICATFLYLNQFAYAYYQFEELYQKSL